MFQWQTLIGSALGAILAIVGSLLLYIINLCYEKRKGYKETLRHIEISITQSLDSIYKVRQQLTKIVERMKELATTVTLTQDNRTFSLERMNFPPVREIYRNTEVTFFKVKSYYLHNKLLWVDAAIKEINEINRNFKNDFADLVRQNELLITLIKENPTPDPSVQRNAYANNLENFSSEIDKYIKEHIPSVIEIIVQIKIYNEYLRKNYCRGFIWRWKNEGTTFKYFKNKKEQRKFARNLESLERVDRVIQEEVKKMIVEIEQNLQV